MGDEQTVKCNSTEAAARDAYDDDGVGGVVALQNHQKIFFSRVLCVPKTTCVCLLKYGKIIL